MMLTTLLQLRLKLPALLGMIAMHGCTGGVLPLSQKSIIAGADQVAMCTEWHSEKVKDSLGDALDEISDITYVNLPNTGLGLAETATTEGFLLLQLDALQRPWEEIDIPGTDGEDSTKRRVRRASSRGLFFSDRGGNNIKELILSEKDDTSDIEAMSVAECGFTMPEYDITPTASCIFLADTGGSRAVYEEVLDENGDVAITDGDIQEVQYLDRNVDKSVLIYKLPSVEQIDAGIPLTMLSRIYLEWPGDTDEQYASEYSGDAAAFDVFPGVTVKKIKKKNTTKEVSAAEKPGIGDWYFIDKSVKGNGSSQNKLFKTRIWRIKSSEWQDLVFAANPKITFGIDGSGSNEAVGVLPLPYLLALEMKNQGIDILQEPYSKFLDFVSESVREKLKALYQGEELSSSIADDALEGISSIADIVDKDKWIEQGGSNPFGTIVVTELAFSRDGRKWFLQTYSGMIEGLINFEEEFPDLKTLLTEDLTRFVGDQYGFQNNPNPLIQMESLAYMPAEVEDKEVPQTALYYSTEATESADAKAELWKLLCVDDVEAKLN